MIMFSCIVSLILLMLCIIRKNSKLTFYLLFTWMWILFAFNHANADFRMYRSIYYGTLSVSSMEYGFVILCKIFRNLGFNYNMFLAVYSFVGLTLIKKTIFKYSKNISLTLALYFIFPFIFDVIQIRNFMAFAIVIYAIKYLIDENEKNIKKYIFLVLIASMFHSFSIIALAFIFLNKFNSSKSILISFLIISGLVIILRNGLLVDILSKVLNSDKVAAYFIDSRYMPGFKTSLLSIMICLLMFMISRLIYNKNAFSSLTYQIFVFILILIPLLFYNATIMRFQRSMLILLYIGFSNNIKIRTLKNKYIYNKKNMFISLLFIILITLWVDTFILSINNQKTTIYPVLRDNYFVEIFNEKE